MTKRNWFKIPSLLEQFLWNKCYVVCTDDSTDYVLDTIEKSIDIDTIEKSIDIAPDPEKVKISAEKQRQIQSLKRAILKYAQRLQVFLDTGVWKNRTEIKISDEDSRLQDLLIYINKQWFDIKSRASGLYTQINDLKELNDKAVEKIQTELKFRETRRDKRKFTFLIDT